MSIQINAAACGGDGIWPSMLSLGQPDMAMFGCRNGRTPAFLTKTYNIVNDLDTNSIISWNLFGNSFIIWDHLKFSSDILPRYFKHSNFSSFVYQLNNYGFRKIGVDHMWEYENVNFQAGKEHLLVNIRRRNQIPGRVVSRRRRWRVAPGPFCPDTTISPEIVSNLKIEIEEIKRRQMDMELDIMGFESELKCNEKKSGKIVRCLAKTCDAMIGNESGRETRPEDGGSEENVDMETSPMNSPLAENVSSSDMDDCSKSYTSFWKKILMEDENESENVEMEDRQAKIAMDLESLIENPSVS
ncbi:heat stress transcription factor A-7a-like [Andrographis paniculata]|uniref:heat stress transcription factor A-7a-like n=1 Tax=Andrographis paniculata TaxID=175694 RepID=UPI0021E7BD97|nr:heat stress transcription factor A-7a-like [Andrographis paniculata]